MADAETQWLVDLHEEHGTTLHRLAVMLGADAESEQILRDAFVGLSRRAHRLVDPQERVEFLSEEVVHDARSARGPLGSLTLPGLPDSRPQEILDAIGALPIRLGEVVVISHYLSVYGPELAGILRMTVRSANRRLEEGLHQLRQQLREPKTSGDAIEALSQEVVTVLRASARLVEPVDSDAFAAQLRTLNGTGRRGVALTLFVPLLVGALALGFWLAAATTPDSVVQAVPSTSPTTSPTASASRSLPAHVRAVPVYYVGSHDLSLYRELRNLPATGDLVRDAIEAILELLPQDPDYDSLWASGRVNQAELTGHTLELDMSPSVYEQLTTKEEAQAAVDQIVYTASELMGDPELRVTFLSDGGPPPTLLRNADGFGRRGLEPMPALWITSPKNEDTFPAGQLLIEGTVKPDASAPVVRIVNADGDTVSSASAQTATDANAAGWRVWSVLASLDPGTYSIEATTMMEGDDGLVRSVAENKTVTVS